MKTKAELGSMLFSRLAELRDGRIKIENPAFANRLRIELALLYDILGEEVDALYWEEIEEEIY